MAESQEVGGVRAASYAGNEPGISTVELLGFPVVAAAKTSLLNHCLHLIDIRQQTHIVTLNPEMVLVASRDANAARLIGAGDLYVADGVGIEWAANWRGLSRVRRYPGVDLCRDIMAAIAPRGGRVYLLGGQPGVAEEAGRRLTAQYPGLNITGLSHGYFEPSDEAGVVSNIRLAGADLLLVGIGSPRQEGFISQNRDELAVPLMVGVGGALEVYAGIKRRAPVFMRHAGLEWAWRSMQDVSRLKRLGVLPSFVLYVVRGGGQAA